jgi:hypothetical protein
MSDEKLQEYKYEFSFMWEGRLHFVHLWDTNDLSACQRVCCLPVQSHHVTYDDTTKNGFFIDDQLTAYAFKKEPYKLSTIVPDCSPHPSELSETKKPKPDALEVYGF